MLKECILSICRQIPEDLNYEIIITDDGSDDKTDEIVSSLISERRNIKYYKQIHKGIASARNLCIKKSSYDILAFIDDDCVVDDHWIYNILKVYQDYPDEIVFQGSLLNVQNANWLQQAYKRLINIYIDLLIEPKDSSGRIHINTFGCNFTARKDLFVKYGLFDEDFKSACEDRDFLQKLLKNKQKILYVPQITATHLYPKDMINFIGQQIDYGDCCEIG